MANEKLPQALREAEVMKKENEKLTVLQDGSYKRMSNIAA